MAAPTDGPLPWYDADTFALTHIYVEEAHRHHSVALSCLLLLQETDVFALVRPRLVSKMKKALHLLYNTWDCIYLTLNENIGENNFLEFPGIAHVISVESMIHPSLSRANAMHGLSIETFKGRMEEKFPIGDSLQSVMSTKTKVSHPGTSFPPGFNAMGWSRSDAQEKTDARVKRKQVGSTRGNNAITAHQMAHLWATKVQAWTE